MIGHWLNTELWGPLWPNTVAPSAWTLLAVVVSHVKAARQRERHHEDMKQHVTAATGGAVEDAEQRTIKCPACGVQVPADEAGKLDDHDRNGITCVASGWTIKEK